MTEGHPQLRTARSVTLGETKEVNRKTMETELAERRSSASWQSLLPSKGQNHPPMQGSLPTAAPPRSHGQCLKDICNRGPPGP